MLIVLLPSLQLLLLKLLADYPDEGNLSAVVEAIGGVKELFLRFFQHYQVGTTPALQVAALLGKLAFLMGSLSLRPRRPQCPACQIRILLIVIVSDSMADTICPVTLILTGHAPDDCARARV